MFQALIKFVPLILHDGFIFALPRFRFFHSRSDNVVHGLSKVVDVPFQVDLIQDGIKTQNISESIAERLDRPQSEAFDFFGIPSHEWSPSMQKRLQKKEKREVNANFNVLPSISPTFIDSIKGIKIPNINLTEVTVDGMDKALSAATIYPRSNWNSGIESVMLAEEKSSETDTDCSHYLIDQYNRRHGYVRISLTDRCNFRCQYCMPNGNINCSSPSELLSPSEIAQLVRIFIELGIHKVRLTGGEPTFRPEFNEIVSVAIPSESPVDVYALTTNGILLKRYIDVVQQSRVNQITLSLDSLTSSTFESICQRRGLHIVWTTLLELIERNFCLVKINCVVMRGINDQEILDFINLTEYLPIHVRFIEFMPFTENGWKRDLVISKYEILGRVQKYFGSTMKRLARHSKTDVAELFQIEGYKGCFGIISPVSDIFCKSCDRIRVNSDGTLKNCLFSPYESMSLRKLLKENCRDAIVNVISHIIQQKEEKLGGSTTAEELSTKSHFNRPMSRIGG